MRPETFSIPSVSDMLASTVKELIQKDGVSPFVARQMAIDAVLQQTRDREKRDAQAERERQEQQEASRPKYRIGEIARRLGVRGRDVRKLAERDGIKWPWNPRFTRTEVETLVQHFSRQARRLTYSDVARRIGCAEGTVYRYAKAIGMATTRGRMFTECEVSEMVQRWRPLIWKGKQLNRRSRAEKRLKPKPQPA